MLYLSVALGTLCIQIPNIWAIRAEGATRH